MRRSICFTEPKFVYAGQKTTIKFIYSPANNLPKGSRLKFDPLSKGREIDWEIPQPLNKSSHCHIWLTTPQGTVVAAKAIQGKSKICPQFEFIMPHEIKAGDEVVIHMGQEHSNDGCRAQLHVQRRRPF